MAETSRTSFVWPQLAQCMTYSWDDGLVSFVKLLTPNKCIARKMVELKAEPQLCAHHNNYSLIGA